jgi:hypothetical protein
MELFNTKQVLIHSREIATANEKWFKPISISPGYKEI